MKGFFIMEELLTILENLKPGVDFAAQTDLIEDHILDSMSVVMLVGELNDEFDIEITPVDVVPENFKTVDAIYAMIQRLSDD
jgi:acyl carrier protein